MNLWRVIPALLSLAFGAEETGQAQEETGQAQGPPDFDELMKEVG